MSKESNFRLASKVAFLALIIHVASWFQEDDQQSPLWRCIIDGTLATLLLATGLICRDIAGLRPSDYMPYTKIAKAYLFNRGVYLYGIWLHREFVRASKGVENAQRAWLEAMVKKRRETVFGKDLGFDAFKTVKDFRDRVPINGYDLYRRYAERTADGEDKVLIPEKTVYIILTSGTTGNNKKFPLSTESMWEFARYSMALPMYARSRDHPQVVGLRKLFSVWVGATVVTNDAGLRMGPVSACADFDPGVCTPFFAIKDIKDESVIMYIHAVFGLLHDDTEQIAFNFVSLARSFFFTLESKWQEVVEDIRTGTLNSRLDVKPEMRAKLKQEMWADPRRADELYQEFSKGFDNILPRVWPHVHHVEMLSSGTLQTPSLTLQKKYFPGIPVWSSFHGASEGSYGICLEPDNILSTYYTMLPNNSFYEFIPLEEIEEPNPGAKLMHELELNEQYELCMTTSRGVCRYRTGDIIKVVSYFNQIPKYEFIGRYGQILNICGEKTSENTFNTAFEDTMAKLREFSLVDYTTAENRSLDTIQETTGNERYYILFVEFESKNLLTDEQKDMFDEDLQVYNENYKELREAGRIQKMVVIQTLPGSFSLLKQHILAANPRTSCGQFKTPRVLRKKADLSLMLGRVAHP